MNEMPRYSPYRPDFMAPGPHVNILKDKPISFENVQPEDGDIDEDEDTMVYKYYPSDKILGKL